MSETSPKKSFSNKVVVCLLIISILTTALIIASGTLPNRMTVRH